MKKAVVIGGGIVVLLIALLLLTGSLNLSVGSSRQGQEKKAAATEPVDPASVAFETYRNEERGIQLNYPANWQPVEGQNQDPTQVVIFISPAEIGADLNLSVRVQVDEQAENVTLGALTGLFVQSYEQQYPEGIKLEEGDVVLGGVPGRYLVYKASSGGVDAKWVAVWTEKDGVPYIVTYSATQELYGIYLPLVEQMLASFEILR